MPKKQLSPKQLNVLQALALGSDVTAAAARAGVHRTTVHTWCRTLPAFRAALREAKVAHAEAIQEQLRTVSNSAVAVIRNILDNETSSESTRLRAALAIIRVIEANHPDRQTPRARDYETFMEAAMYAGAENDVYYRTVGELHEPSTLQNSSQPITSAASAGRAGAPQA